MTRREFFGIVWGVTVYVLAQSMRAFGFITGKGIPS